MGRENMIVPVGENILVEPIKVDEVTADTTSETPVEEAVTE